MLVRISEIEIDADHLEEYKAILREEAEASVRLEPGVISIFPMCEKENPTEVSSNAQRMRTRNSTLSRRASCNTRRTPCSATCGCVPIWHRATTASSPSPPAGAGVGDAHATGLLRRLAPRLLGAASGEGGFREALKRLLLSGL